MLPSDVYTEVINLVRHAHKEEWMKYQVRQQQKFTCLANGNINTLADQKHIPIMDVSKAKQPESGDLFSNITEFGVAEGHLSPQG